MLAKVMNTALGNAGLDEVTERKVRAALREAILTMDKERQSLAQGVSGTQE